MIVTPHYQCDTARAKFLEVILSASSNRVTIAERAEKAKTLQGSGLGLTIVPTKRVSGGLVSADGVIIVTSEDPPAFVVLRPRMENGVVQWTCGGLPIKSISGSCREPPFRRYRNALPNYCMQRRSLKREQTVQSLVHNIS